MRLEPARIGIHESTHGVFPPSVLRDALTDVGPDVVVVADDADIDDVDAVVTLEHRDAFLDAGLVWVHSIQSGVDRFPFDAFRERRIALTSSAGIHGPSVGETVAGYMLAFARRLHVHVGNQAAHEWDRGPWDAGFTLADRSICVVGLGTLGRGIATRAAGLGMRVEGVKRTVEPVEAVDKVYPATDLLDAIAGQDFVALAVPLTDETRGMIDRAALSAMDEGAYLINVARGPVVDEAALIEALRVGDVAGAALDVFENEPLAPDSPLWEMEEVIVTPHAASLSREYHEGVASLVRENLQRGAASEPLRNRVV